MKKILLSAIAMLLLLSSVAIFASCSDDSTDDIHESLSFNGESDSEGTSSESTNDSTVNNSTDSNNTNDTDNNGETTSDTTETETSDDTTGGEQWSQDRK